MENEHKLNCTAEPKRCEVCNQPVAIDEYEEHKEDCLKKKETKMFLEEQKHRDDEEHYNREKIVKITSGLEVDMVEFVQSAV